MLKINRLIVEIDTEKGKYGIDETFNKGLNFVSSFTNTCGKSSVLAAIYYCLGLEQIIGGSSGIGSKVLTSVFKTAVNDGIELLNVIKSAAYLEISNGANTVTLYRNIKCEGKDNRLITVFYSDYNLINYETTSREDFYVNTRNSTISEKGFHHFLEEFLGIDLPMVKATDGYERKLYFQILFSAMFIEQKHGWSAILSGMPLLGIKESRKRVIEFLLNLDTLKNEKEVEKLNSLKIDLQTEWREMLETLEKTIGKNGCKILSIPRNIRKINVEEYNGFQLVTLDDESIDSALKNLELERRKLNELRPRIIENFNLLNKELLETQKTIVEAESKSSSLREKIFYEKQAIKRLEVDIENISIDIRNNQDAQKLKKMGSETLNNYMRTDICPTCKQKIYDNLLSDISFGDCMSIEENLRHLAAQKEMLMFTINAHKKNLENLQQKQISCETNLVTLRRLAQSLRSDLYYSTEGDISEAIVLKRIEFSKRINELLESKRQFGGFIEKIKVLSDKWEGYISKKKNLPKSGFTDNDEIKLGLLNKKFVENLKLFNYSSLSDFNSIEISKESLLPTIDGFDMRFDSSASDGIRVIWAFTLALLQVSNEMRGNHLGLIIFDEPAQQSIVATDMEKFINAVNDLPSNNQIIIAITLNSKEVNDIISCLTEMARDIRIEGKAFKRIFQ